MPSEELLERAAQGVLDHTGLLARRLRQRPVTGELTQPEAAVLARLVGEAATVADLARAEGVRPQSMGAVVGALESRGLVKRQRDRSDGRRVLLSATGAGREVIGLGRTARGDQLVRALSAGFTDEELEQLVALAPLLGRLAGQLGLD